VFYNLRKKINRWRFDGQTYSVKEKVRIKTDPQADFVLVTQLCDSDVNMYLIALSSFCRYLKPNLIIVVSDGLTDDSQETLRGCIEGLKIVPVESFRHDDLPAGGTWERLNCILRHIEDSYVVQMDADIITLSYPDEVAQSIEQGRSFTITSRLGFEKMSFVNASYLVWERESRHVQNEAEKVFKQCNNAEKRLYIRGCSGFSGFAKGSSSLQSLIEFSKEMDRRIGRDKWREWGSEQVASNYIIANSENSVILPFDSYPFFEPGLDESKAKLIHFIGTHRYKNGRYIALARQIIDSL
jgi:glycosyltransferase involved in cell wall biosynthesis